MAFTKDDLITEKKKVYHKILVNGNFGVGKTYFAMTYPKWAYCMIEPNGIMTAKSNPQLLENMVNYDIFTPSDEEDIKVTFERLDKYLAQVKADAKAGLVETFILDNLTHLSKARWIFIEKYNKTFGKSGNVDTMAMFGELSRWLNRFILTQVITLPCHVIVPVHEMEEEETDDSTGKSTKTGRTITNTLGGFRNDAAGLFNASIFLEVKQGTPKKYVALCQPTTRKPAKNNLGLPELVENISYQAIIGALNSKK